VTLPIGLQARGIYVPFYDYFAIKDQAGVTWYWWITKSADIEWGLSPLTYVHRNPREVVLSPIPSWLALVDATAVTRYVYPKTLTGEILVASSAPAVGTGYTGSPLVQSMNLGFYTITSTHHQDVNTVRT
jgi:hypothetical protein